MNSLDKLKAIYDYIKVPEPPAIKGSISGDMVLQIYSDIFPNARDKIFISDSVYEITAISEIRRFVDWDKTDIGIYVPDKVDCDDFSLTLAGDFARYPGWAGFPVSFIWGTLYGGHAFVTALAWPSFEDRTPRAYFIEPQNDHEIAEESVEEMSLWLLAI